MSSGANNSIFDVAIVGAGPAGAAAARLLASWGHSVVVIGRPPRHAPLAESLPPSCARLFDQIGIHDEIDSAGFIRATGNTVQWAGRERRVESFDKGSFGYQVARDAFDGVLVSAARAIGATVHSGANVRDVTRANPDLWRVSYDEEWASRECLARWVLDCSGRAGVIARRGWRRAGDAGRTTAIAGVWESVTPWPMQDDTHTLVESYEGGWAWSVPVTPRKRFVTVMVDPSLTTVPSRAGLSEAYHSELSQTASVSALVRNATCLGAPWGCDASSYSAERVCDDQMLLIGDAASFVDPLSSFGIKKALASAWLGSVAIHTAMVDSRLSSVALDLFAQRERTMYDHLQRQSALLSRDAASAHEGGFWVGRSDAMDAAPAELDAAGLRSDPRVLGAFEELKRRQAVRLRVSEGVTFAERATVRGDRVVLQEHLTAPGTPQGVRYCRNVDLVLIARLAPQSDQVPDLFDAYNRAAPPAPLPDFLGALSTLIGLGVLRLA